MLRSFHKNLLYILNDICAISQWSILGPLLLRIFSNHTVIMPKLHGPEISQFLPCMLQFLNNLRLLSTLAPLWKELGCLVQKYRIAI